MIKIIKEGTRQTITCDNCGCVFSYEQEDIEERTFGMFSARELRGYEKYILCPQCKRKIHLEGSK